MSQTNDSQLSSVLPVTTVAELKNRGIQFEQFKQSVIDLFVAFPRVGVFLFLALYVYVVGICKQFCVHNHL